MADGVNIAYHKHTVERLEGERDRLIAARQSSRPTTPPSQQRQEATMLTDDELAAIAEIPLHGDVPRLVAEIRAQREVIRVAFDTIHAGRFYDAEQLLLTALAAPDDRAPRGGG